MTRSIDEPRGLLELRVVFAFFGNTGHDVERGKPPQRPRVDFQRRKRDMAEQTLHPETGAAQTSLQPVLGGLDHGWLGFVTATVDL